MITTLIILGIIFLIGLTVVSLIAFALLYVVRKGLGKASDKIGEIIVPAKKSTWLPITVHN